MVNSLWLLVLAFVHGIFVFTYFVFVYSTVENKLGHFGYIFLIFG